ERRPKGLRGRLGIPVTERLVGRRHQASNSIGRGQVFATLSRPHSWTHPEGWRDWPYETPPTCPVKSRDKVAIPSGSKTNSLGDAVLGFPRFPPSLPPPHHRAEEPNRCRQKP